jgi:hypothetical protein
MPPRRLASLRMNHGRVSGPTTAAGLDETPASAGVTQEGPGLRRDDEGCGK